MIIIARVKVMHIDVWSDVHSLSNWNCGETNPLQLSLYRSPGGPLHGDQKQIGMYVNRQLYKNSN